MKTFILTDVNETFRVELVTDAVSNEGNFTVMQVKGLDAFEKALGADYKQLPYNGGDLQDYAAEHDLKLYSIDNSLPVGQGVTVLVDFSGMYYNGGLGLDNL